MSSERAWSKADVSRFNEAGFVILRGWSSAGEVAAIRAVALRDMSPVIGPAEFEAEVGYDGAPEGFSAQGGRTPRRLKHALARGEVIRQWATAPRLGALLRTLWGGRRPLLSQAHHNCIMTKCPDFSSQTPWHQDIRYWNFARPELVSIWLALGHEGGSNGGLKVIAGTHAMTLEGERFDEARALREDHPANEALLANAQQVMLEAGDLMVFHCRLLHAADANRTDVTKLSLVLSAHPEDNAPVPGTRSARYPSLPFRDV